MSRYWKQGFGVLALAVAAGLCCYSPTLAAKPGGGPGGGGGGGDSPPPEGTVYFSHEGTIWQMDAAGTPESRSPLATANACGDPSYGAHGGERWFAYEAHSVQTFPNGRPFSQIRATSESGLDIQLLSETDIEVISWDSITWAPDDGSITFVGERWELDLDDQPVAVDIGLYELFVDFSSGTPVATGLDFVADLSGPMQAGPDGFPGPYAGQLAGHSWNPDRTQVAFGVRITYPNTEYIEEIWVADLAAGTLSLLDSGNAVGWPHWSPDGSRIGYFTKDSAVVLNLSSGRTKELRRTVSTRWEEMFWSPTGDHIVIGHYDGLLNAEDAIYRLTADLRDKTELTAGLEAPIPRGNTLYPLGWRN